MFKKSQKKILFHLSIILCTHHILYQIIINILYSVPSHFICLPYSVLSHFICLLYSRCHLLTLLCT